MNRSLGILLCALLLFGASTSVMAQPARCTSFDELLTSLKEGWTVRTTIEYAKCRLVIDSVEHQSPEAIGGMSIETYEYFGRGVVRNVKAYLATSETHVISHPRHGYVLNYVRLRIYEDDAVEITARYLNPTTYAVVMDETFFGSISTGTDGNGVHLYRSQP
ncbi:MAG: hypothetical protein MUE68_06765 [Bacteroidetes bacterium]|jgi:hypothetical protein|nr:hypothetical protein [Bacteroidota bacterium]